MVSTKSYRIVFTPEAKKYLLKMDAKDAQAIEKKLILLSSGSLNLDIKKLVAFKKPTYRLRVGDYRVVYEIFHQEIIIKIIRIAHRREVYDF